MFERPRTTSRIWIDVVIAIVLLAGSSIWATRFWNAWTAQGGQPSFYQIYFEPAVMVACGKGFVVSEQGQPKPLEDFLWRRQDTFDCRDIPVGLKLSRLRLYQGAWIYLQYTVGWSWRILGISWSGMAPLFGLFFGSVIALAYALFRLGMGRSVALFCALALTASSTHLLNLPHLRDYAPAPFMLGLIFMLGLLVLLPVRRRTLLVLGAVYGLVLGVGYGFRTDFLAYVPLFVVVLFAFLEGGPVRHITSKVLSAVVCVAVFAIVSWPATSAVYTGGGCQWHAALLGLQSPFDARLRIQPAPYDFGYAYSDGYVVRTVQGYTARTRPDAAAPAYCLHSYDVESGRYLRSIVASFPADFIARAYASVLQVAELPFLTPSPPVAGWAESFYHVRSRALTTTHRWGLVVVVLSLLLIAGVSIRLGLFALFCLLYFGGYPSVQFHERHFFYLEFMTWWAFGFVVYRVGVFGRSVAVNGPPDAGPMLRRVMVAVGLMVGVAGLLAAVLGIARAYQTRQARQLLGAYLAAPKEPIEIQQGHFVAPARGQWPQYVEVDLDSARCDPKQSVTFRYDQTSADGDLTRVVAMSGRATGTGTTHILLPVFQQFKGIELSDPRPGCLVDAYRLTDLHAFPVLLGATLPPNWEDLPLYQRLAVSARD